MWLGQSVSEEVTYSTIQGSKEEESSSSTFSPPPNDLPAVGFLASKWDTSETKFVKVWSKLFSQHQLIYRVLNTTLQELMKHTCTTTLSEGCCGCDQALSTQLSLDKWGGQEVVHRSFKIYVSEWFLETESSVFKFSADEREKIPSSIWFVLQLSASEKGVFTLKSSGAWQGKI